MTGVPTERTSRTAKIVSYGRLAKLDAYHQLYGWLLAVLLLWRDSLLGVRADIALVLVLVTTFGIKCASCAADDIMGFRNGGDAMNYQTQAYRPPSRKPLLTGRLTESEAVSFTVVTTLIGLAAGFGALFALDWDVPLGVVILFAIMSAVAVQYSSGLKLSYHPGGLELVVFSVSACTVLLPYWLIADGVSAGAITLGLLMGVWLVLVVSYANLPDREGDAAVGRRTIAVIASPRTVDAVLSLLCVAALVLTVWPFVTGTLNGYAILCVVPVLVMNLAQLYVGVVRKEALRARMIGFYAIDVGSVGFAAAILLSGR